MNMILAFKTTPPIKKPTRKPRWFRQRSREQRDDRGDPDAGDTRDGVVGGY